MAELTLQQQQAIALANARRRAAEAASVSTVESTAPAPASNEIDWQEMLSQGVRQGVSSVPFATGLSPFTDPIIEAAFGSPTNEASDTDPWGEPSGIAPVQFQEGTGAVRFAMPQIGQDMLDAIMGPGRALQGEMNELEVDPISGAVSPFNDEMVESAALAAGFTTGGRLPTVAKETLHLPSGQRVPRQVTKALEADGVAPAEASRAVADIGPDAVVADVGENTRNITAAVAGTPGPGQTVVTDVLKQRKIDAPNRVTAGIDEAIGEAPVPSYVQSEIKGNMRNVGPEYERLLQDAPDADPEAVAALAAGLDEIAAREKGSLSTAAQSARALLNANGSDDLDVSAQGLFAARKAINETLSGQIGGHEATILKDVRDKLTALIETVAPGIREIDARYSELGEQSRAVDKGQTVLGSGREDLRPQELNDYISENVSPNGEVYGPSGVPFRLSQGARAEIDRLVGTKLNDRVALAQILKGESDWNRDRLVSLFGEDRTDALYRLLDRERTMAETENLALSGSKTSAMQSAKEDIAGKPGPGPLKSALNFQAGDAASSAVDKWFSGRRDRRNALIAEAVTGPGEWLRRRMQAGGQGPVVAGGFAAASANGPGEQQPSEDEELMTLLRQMM